MNFINREDPDAFITVYNVSDMRYRPKGVSSKSAPISTRFQKELGCAQKSALERTFWRW